MYLEEDWGLIEAELGSTPAGNFLMDINKYHIPLEYRITQNEKEQHCEASMARVVALCLFLAGVSEIGVWGMAEVL